ncbi:MAG: GIY-YIG nuclease family protein [Candidatus Gracilibacteria bacterium]|nr:GIY-YIG nuclease family protein [Candidatus Gracilibacteria bacterium]MDD4530556.1 GIY-YIG nuclease family protein [Candidatus Gracilibacteria bacterium]
MKEKGGFIYILTNQRNGTLYIGVTSILPKRIYEHKNKLVDGFTKTYGLDKLVYYEKFDEIMYAIEREKQLKGFLRIKKLKLIESLNPKWEDLSKDLF